MMFIPKKISIILFIFSMVLGTIIFYKYIKNITQNIPVQNKLSEIPLPTLIATPYPNIFHKVSIGSVNYGYAYAKSSTQDVILIPNFIQSDNASQIFAANSCKSLINGGFYDTDHHPLGLFSIKDTTYGSRINSDLTNGFVWLDSLNHIGIDTDFPVYSMQWIFQTGPLLLENSQSVALSIRDDKQARRSVAATTKTGDLIIMSIFLEKQVTSGPNLTDLPIIVKKINDSNDMDIKTAINLDGGGASAFISKDMYIGEIQSVGSFICIK
jgi:hypothetical protein